MYNSDGPVAQLVRAPPCHGGGREFESLLGRFGILAQLGEHLPYKQGVTGSSPVGPTKCRNALWKTFPKMIASQKKTMFPSGTQSKINTPMWLNSGLLTLSIRGEQSREAWLCQLSRKVD